MSDGGDDATSAKAAQARVADALATSITRRRSEREAIESTASDAEAVALCEKQLTGRYGAAHLAFLRALVGEPPSTPRALLLSTAERDEARDIVVRYRRSLLRAQGAELPDPDECRASGAKTVYPEVDLALFDRMRALLETYAHRTASRAQRSFITGTAVFVGIVAVVAFLMWLSTLSTS